MGEGFYRRRGFGVRMLDLDERGQDENHEKILNFLESADRVVDVMGVGWFVSGPMTQWADK